MRWGAVALAFLFPALLPITAWAAPTFDAQASVDVVGDTTDATIEVNFTCTNSSSTVLYVAAHVRETTSTAQAVTAITYNGLTLANFTNVGNESNLSGAGTKSVNLSVWRALPGAACDGAAHQMQVTIANPRIWGFGAISLTGVDQTTPNDAAVVNRTDGTPGTDPTTGTITSAVGDLALGYVARRATDSLTLVAGQTDHYNFVTNHTTTASNLRGIGATEAGAATVSLGWTQGATAEWVTLGINVNAVTVAGRRRVVPLRQFMQLFAPLRVDTLGRSE